VASLSQGRTAAAQCGLFTYKSVPVIFEPPCISSCSHELWRWNRQGVPKRRRKIHTPGNHPKEIIQNSQHGENFKFRNVTQLAEHKKLHKKSSKMQVN